MRSCAGLALLSILAVVPRATPVRADGPPSPTDAAARADELWKRRDDLTALAQQKAVLEQAAATAPADYGLLWRMARWYAWRADDPRLPKDERAQLGKAGWDLAEKAVAINPNHVAAQYWAMAGMGTYALGLGIVRAITQGIEGKFKERLGRAERLDGRYAHGAIAVAWGGYWAKLPWPKYDEALTKDAEIEIPVQILGKLRSKVVVPAGSDQAALVAAARADARIAELLTGKEVVKTIVVPGKLVNFVVK